MVIIKRYQYIFISCAAIFTLLAGAYAIYLRGAANRTAIPQCSKCNLIVIALDPLRADELHVMGNPRSVTPAIDALAQRSYVFTHAYAPSSWTLPSAMSLFTGVYPMTHRITNKELIGNTESEGLTPATLAQAAPSLRTVTDVLRSHGYVTGGFTGGAALNPSFGFDKGFDEYYGSGDFEGFQTTMPKAEAFMDKHKDVPFFLYVQAYDVHGQYTPPDGLTKKFIPPSYRGSLTGSAEEQKSLREQGVTQGSVFLTAEDTAYLRGIYDEKMLRADERIGKFLETVRLSGIADRTIIMFVSDHGEEFNDHGRIDHGMTLYNELVHVPLIISLPHQMKQVTIADQVSTISVAPTVLSLLGVNADEGVRAQLKGSDLATVMSGRHSADTVFFETEYRYATALRAVQTPDGWKYISHQDTRTGELYQTARDPRELNNLLDSEPAVAEKLKKLLTDHFSADSHGTQ